MALMLRTLEITVLSGEDLRLHRKPLKKKSFAVVKIDSQNFCTTRIDENGGSYPSWNQKLALSLPATANFLMVEVHCGSCSRNSVVGAAKVPVSDFVGGDVPETYLHFLSYRLRDCKGERNGIVNIAVRMKVPDVASASRTGMKFQLPAGKPNYAGDGAGVVVGIPVWGGCPNKF